MKKLIAFLLSLLVLCAAFGAPAEEPLFATFGEAQLTDLTVKHMKYDGITSSRPIYSFGPSQKTE